MMKRLLFWHFLNEQPLSQTRKKKKIIWFPVYEATGKDWEFVKSVAWCYRPFLLNKSTVVQLRAKRRFSVTHLLFQEKLER